MINSQTDGVLLTGRKAKYYDLENFFYGVHLVTRQHIDLITLQTGQWVLDIGCGTANTLFELNQQFGNQVRLYGVDPSQDMITGASQKLAQKEGVDVAVGVGESLNFDDNSFDWVISCLTPHHLPSSTRQKMFQECFRVMKPNGYLLISDFGPPTNALGRFGAGLWRRHAFVDQTLNGEIQKAIKQAGLKISAKQTQLGIIHHIQARKPG